MASEAPEHAKGDVIADKFRVVRRLGQGGMGEVYEAEHLITGKRVALKVMLVPKDQDDSAHQRFLREARAACAIRHPAIVNVHDVFTAADRLVIVMDLLKGKDLYAVLGHQKVHYLMAIEYVLPIVSALGHLHAAGFIHRDIKPENIFVADDGTYLLDLGIVKDTRADKRLTTDAVGTPMYMSPEQAFGQSIDHRADVWSLGLVLYEALTGHAPTEAESMGQVFELIREAAFPAISDPEVPTDLAAFVLTMLSRHASHRPEGMHLVYDVLSRYANSTLLSRYPRPPAPPSANEGDVPRKNTLPQGSSPSEPPPSFDPSGPIPSAIQARSERVQRDAPTMLEPNRQTGETPAPMITPFPGAKKKSKVGSVVLALIAAGCLAAIGYFGLIIWKGPVKASPHPAQGTPTPTAEASATSVASVSGTPQPMEIVPTVSASAVVSAETTESASAVASSGVASGSVAVRAVTGRPSSKSASPATTPLTAEPPHKPPPATTTSTPPPAASPTLKLIFPTAPPSN